LRSSTLSHVLPPDAVFLFSFTDTPTTQIYTLSLHDALPISSPSLWSTSRRSGLGSTSLSSSGTPRRSSVVPPNPSRSKPSSARRSEEHTSELQSRRDLVCRLLLEKKKKKKQNTTLTTNIPEQ